MLQLSKIAFDTRLPVGLQKFVWNIDPYMMW